MAFLRSKDRPETQAFLTECFIYSLSHSSDIRGNGLSLAEVNRLLAEHGETLTQCSLYGSTSQTGPMEIDFGQVRIGARPDGVLAGLEIEADRGETWDVDFADTGSSIDFGSVKLSDVRTSTLEILMAQCETIESLRMNGVSQIHRSIYKKDMLLLSVGGESVTELPAGIETCRNLHTLGVSGTLCRSLPEGISLLGKLETAHLYQNLLEECPPLTHPATKRVLLGENRLRCVPEWIGDLTGETKNSQPDIAIDLSGNPAVAGGYILNAQRNIASDLRTIKQEHSKRKADYKRIQNSENGKHIDLSHNLISAIPPWLCGNNIRYDIETADMDSNNHILPPGSKNSPVYHIR